MMTEASKDEQQSIMGSNTNIVRTYLKIGRVMVIALPINVLCAHHGFRFRNPRGGLHGSFFFFNIQIHCIEKISQKSTSFIRQIAGRLEGWTP
jgi:hypothetical protein